MDPYAGFVVSEEEKESVAESESESDSLHRYLIDDDLTPFQFRAEDSRAQRLEKRNMLRKINEVNFSKFHTKDLSKIKCFSNYVSNMKMLFVCMVQ